MSNVTNKLYTIQGNVLAASLICTRWADAFAIQLGPSELIAYIDNEIVTDKLKSSTCGYHPHSRAFHASD